MFENADIFKLLSTAGIFLVGTWWAFRNLKFIMGKINDQIGLPTPTRTRTTESGTKITISQSNTSSNTGS